MRSFTRGKMLPEKAELEQYNEDDPCVREKKILQKTDYGIICAVN